MPLLCGHDEDGSHDEEAYFAEESVQKMQKEVKMSWMTLYFFCIDLDRQVIYSETNCDNICFW